MNEPWKNKKQKGKKKSVYHDAQRFWLGQDTDEIDRRMKTRDWNRRFAVAGRLTMKSSHRKRTNCRHNNYSTARAPARPRRLLADYESIVASVINPSTPPSSSSSLYSCPRIDGQRRNLSSRARSPYPGHLRPTLLGFRFLLDGRAIVTDFFFFFFRSVVRFFFFAFNGVNESRGRLILLLVCCSVFPKFLKVIFSLYYYCYNQSFEFFFLRFLGILGDRIGAKRKK